MFNGVIDHEFWLAYLKQNVNYLNEALKKQFSDDSLLYLKIKASFPIVIQQLSIFWAFEHLLYYTRICDKKKDFCKLCSAVNVVNNDESRMFKDIMIDERNFTTCFRKFIERKSLFSLKICSMSSFWIKVDLARKHHCMYFEYQKKPGHLFVYCLSILIRLYINVFLKVNLNKLNILSLQMPTYRDCIFRSAYDLMFTFCLNPKLNYFC